MTNSKVVVRVSIKHIPFVLFHEFVINPMTNHRICGAGSKWLFDNYQFGRRGYRGAVFNAIPLHHWWYWAVKMVEYNYDPRRSGGIYSLFYFIDYLKDNSRPFWIWHNLLLTDSRKTYKPRHGKASYCFYIYILICYWFLICHNV